MNGSILRLLAVAVIIGSLIVDDAWGRGGRRGGGHFGGGGGGGAISRPSMSARTPSMSRPSVSRPAVSRPSVSRPSTLPSASRPSISRPSIGTGNRPSVGGGTRPDFGGNRPSINRPELGNNRPSFGNRPDASRPGLSGNRPDFSQRPTEGGLQDFLDLPGRPQTQPGIATRPGTGDRRNIGDRTNIGSRIDMGDRTNVGDRVNNIGDRNRVDVGDININAGNRMAINRENNIASIRNKWANAEQRPFGRDWWSTHHFDDHHDWHWHDHWDRYPDHWCWRAASWAAIGGWFAWTWSEPYSYDYGSTIVYQDDNVYVNDQQVATADQYYQQAETIAASVPENVDDAMIQWMPLGVFAIAEQSATDTGMMVQLAVSKEGIIAGTFYNDITGSSRPLEGTVDQKTQRAAWKFSDGQNTDIVMETGIYNLTKDETTALVHFGQDKTETWLMVRLPEPEENDSEGNPRPSGNTSQAVPPAGS